MRLPIASPRKPRFPADGQTGSCSGVERDLFYSSAPTALHMSCCRSGSLGGGSSATSPTAPTVGFQHRGADPRVRAGRGEKEVSPVDGLFFQYDIDIFGLSTQ